MHLHLSVPVSADKEEDERYAGAGRPVKLAEAVLRVAQIQQRLALGLDPRQSMLPLGQWFDSFYLPSIEQRNRSWRTDLSRFNAHIRPVLGARRVCEISAFDLTLLIESLRPSRNRIRPRERLANSTVNRAIALLTALFAKLVADGHINENPALGLRQRRERNQRARVLREIELPRFLAALADAPPKVNMLLRLMLLTGIRLGEALSARWSEIDLDRRHLRLPDTKAGKPRVVPLSNEALEVLDELAAMREAASDFLFSGRGGRGHMQRPGRRFSAVLAAAGIEGLWLHDLRRTFATLAAQQVPIQDVSRLLGHSTVKVTERYVVTDDAGLNAAVASVGRQLRPALEQAISTPSTSKES